MLVRLLPENVSEMWPKLKELILPVLPPATRDRDEVENEVLRACLDGTLTVWLLGKPEDQRFSIYVVVTTMPYIDSPTNTWSLLIYTLLALKQTPKELWLEGLKKLAEYARRSGFHSIVGFSDVPNMISIAEKLGADVNTRFITLRV